MHGSLALHCAILRVCAGQVRGRQSHPRIDSPEYGSALNSSSWKTLGSFSASKVKGSQKFQMQQPSWVKYLQLQFLTHYGSEAVCALNDVRVYGKSAAEDLEDRLALDAAGQLLVDVSVGCSTVITACMPNLLHGAQHWRSCLSGSAYSQLHSVVVMGSLTIFCCMQMKRCLLLSQDRPSRLCPGQMLWLPGRCPARRQHSSWRAGQTRQCSRLSPHRRMSSQTCRLVPQEPSSLAAKQGRRMAPSQVLLWAWQPPVTA